MSQFKKLGYVAICGAFSIGVASDARAQNANQNQQAQANAAANANAQANYYYNGINETPWFGNQNIREQLHLNDNQYQQLNQGYGHAWGRYNQGVNGLDNGLSEALRMQRQQELYGTFHQDFSQSTNDVFNDPTASKRYNQLYLQYRGYGAFSDPTVQQELKLTPAQRQKFQKYDRDWNRNMNTWHREYESNPDVVLKRFNSARGEYQQSLN